MVDQLAPGRLAALQEQKAGLQGRRVGEHAEHAEGPRVRVDHGGADDSFCRQCALFGEFGADSAEEGTRAIEGEDKFSNMHVGTIFYFSFHLPFGHVAQTRSQSQILQSDLVQEALVPADLPAVRADLVVPVAHQRAQRPRLDPTLVTQET